MKLHLLVLSMVCIALAWIASPADAFASTEVPADVYQRAAVALDEGDYDLAILELESLADDGVVHPDVSFNRGLAYASRARSDDAQMGDLGRAAVGFEEAVRLRPGDADAMRALDAVRAEVTRRRSRQDKSDVVVRPSIDRAVVQLLSPAIWSIAAMIASLLFGIGIVMRLRRSGWVHVTGTVLAPLALVAAIALVPMAAFARDLADTRFPGVIVDAEAVLEGDDDKRLDAPVIPEASLVEIGERKDDEVFVRWGNYEGWVPYRTVRAVVVD